MYSSEGVPSIILDLVIDALLSSMNPLPLEALAVEENSVTRVEGCGLERRTFFNMSLVHPSWTDVARRGLWHTIVLRASELVDLKVPVSASNCIHTQELAVMLPDEDSPPAQACWANITRILEYSPNIRFLYVDMCISAPADAGSSSFIQQLRTRVNLERIWFVGTMEGRLQDILISVSHLKNLKSLLFDTVHSDYERDGLPQDVGPPKELESLALVDLMDWSIVDWLTQPREDYKLVNLAISLDEPEQVEEDSWASKKVVPCLPFLQTLDISTTTTDPKSECEIHAGLYHLLNHARSLRTFGMSVMSAIQTPSLPLPSTITSIRIHHDFATLHLNTANSSRSASPHYAQLQNHRWLYLI